VGNPTKLFAPGPVVEPQILSSEAELDTFTCTFAIHCSRLVLDQMYAHAKSFANTEVFGLLLGRVYRSPSFKLRTLIEDFIPAQSFHTTTLSFVEVSPHELLRMDRVYEELGQKAGLLKVGWFHTHPGHGIFMSQTDRENHRMYSKTWQVALVIDPVNNSHGFFWGGHCVEVREVIYSDTPFRPNPNLTGSLSISAISSTGNLKKSDSSPKLSRQGLWAHRYLIGALTAAHNVLRSLVRTLKVKPKIMM
jgi:proteasome lid subunit RPN8/RPN11